MLVFFGQNYIKYEEERFFNFSGRDNFVKNSRNGH